MAVSSPTQQEVAHGADDSARANPLKKPPSALSLHSSKVPAGVAKRAGKESPDMAPKTPEVSMRPASAGARPDWCAPNMRPKAGALHNAPPAGSSPTGANGKPRLKAPIAAAPTPSSVKKAAPAPSEASPKQRPVSARSAHHKAGGWSSFGIAPKPTALPRSSSAGSTRGRLSEDGGLPSGSKSYMRPTSASSSRGRRASDAGGEIDPNPFRKEFQRSASSGFRPSKKSDRDTLSQDTSLLTVQARPSTPTRRMSEESRRESFARLAAHTTASDRIRQSLTQEQLIAKHQKEQETIPVAKDFRAGKVTDDVVSKVYRPVSALWEPKPGEGDADTFESAIPKPKKSVARQESFERLARHTTVCHELRASAQDIKTPDEILFGQTERKAPSRKKDFRTGNKSAAKDMFEKGKYLNDYAYTENVVLAASNKVANQATFERLALHNTASRENYANEREYTDKNAEQVFQSSMRSKAPPKVKQAETPRPASPMRASQASFDRLAAHTTVAARTRAMAAQEADRTEQEKFMGSMRSPVASPAAVARPASPARMAAAARLSATQTAATAARRSMVGKQEDPDNQAKRDAKLQEMYKRGW